MLRCAAFSNAGQQKDGSDKGAGGGNKEKQRAINRRARVGELLRN
jgi:hypothetical protein